MPEPAILPQCRNLWQGGTIAASLWLRSFDKSQAWTARINPTRADRWRARKGPEYFLNFEPYVWTQCVPDEDYNFKYFHYGASHRGHLWAEGGAYDPRCWEETAPPGTDCGDAMKHCRGCRMPLHPVNSDRFAYFFQSEWQATADQVGAIQDLQPLSVRAQKVLGRNLHSSHNRGPLHWVPWIQMFDWIFLQWNPSLYKLVDANMRETIFCGYPRGRSLPYVGAFLVRQKAEPQTVFMPTQLLPYFIRHLLEPAPTPGLAIYLGRGWEDAWTPRGWLRYAARHPKVLHVFAENPRYRHPKVTAMPIGMDAHFLAHESGKALVEIASTIRLEDKMVDKVAGGWAQIGPYRRAATEFMNDKSWCDWIDTSGAYGYRNIEYWKRISRYGFVLSPPASYLGQGPRGPMGDGDSYRTFEALILGTIPILIDTQNARAWHGLPVVIVKNWTEITQERLRTWWAEKSPQLSAGKSFLYSSYWWAKIETSVNASGYW